MLKKNPKKMAYIFVGVNPDERGKWKIGGRREEG